MTTGLSVFTVTVLVKILDAAKSILSVSRFGVTAQADVYNIIITIPELIIVVIGLDTIRGAATTYFTEYVTKGEKEKLEGMFSSLLTWGIAVSVVIGVASVLLMPVIVHTIASGFTGDKLSLTITLAYIIIPVLVLRGVVGIIVSVFYAHNSFIRVTVMSALTSVMVLATLIFSDLENLARNVAIAYCVGFCIYVVLLVVLSRKYVRWKFTFRNVPPEFWDVLAFSGQLVLATVIAQIAGFVETRTASFFPDGTVAALNYANMPPSQFVFLVVVSLFGVMQRQLAAKISEGKHEEAIRDYWQMLSYLLFTVIFCVAVFMVLRKPVLSVLYKRQSFGEAALERTAAPLFMYALWMVGQTVSLTTTTLLLAAKRSKIFVISSLFAYGFDVCMVGFFSRWFGYTGIALSSLLTITFYSIFLLIGTRMVFGKGALAGGRHIFRIFAVGLVTAVLMQFLFQKMFMNTEPVFGEALTQVAVVAGAGFLIYLALASVLKVNYANSLWLRIREQFAGAAR
ncbi:MAG TPA: lipid II flippase MurJ [Candidatus Kapabacteria bacterium]|nr:lipid II flippase MurJ [Candidatus Kapabacteria bacterium]